jgi:hypothetical protein
LPGGDFGISARMSTFNRIVVGLCLGMVFTLISAAARGQSASEDPPSSELQPPKQARSSSNRYVLLMNGRLIPGVVSETESEVVVEQRVGTMRFPKKQVEGSFDSIRQAYEYKLSQLPERDSEEQMKLALWCLHLKLTAEAGQLIHSVLEQNPNHAQAKAMQVSLEQAAKRLARRERDPEVRQTKVEPMADERPEALDSAILRNAQRGLGVKDLPVIFDLPLPLAIKRTEEFANYVHPLLQRHCAHCHDAQHPGKFQLVSTKARADRTVNALRANLDATLQLIDPVNPSHSELLSVTLRPHGDGAKPRPIFLGSNDRAYQVLAAWANHLVAPKDGDESTRRGAMGGSSGKEEVFAVDRNRSRAAQPPSGAGAMTAAPTAPNPRYAPEARGPLISQDPSDPQEFPIPFAISGVKPKLPPPKSATNGSAKRPSIPPPSKAHTAGMKTKAAAVPDEDADDDDDVDDLPKPATKKAAKAAAKPLTIDPKVLERALQIRNANRPNPGSN